LPADVVLNPSNNTLDTDDNRIRWNLPRQMNVGYRTIDDHCVLCQQKVATLHHILSDCKYAL
jgi:hypothetical protein